MPPLILIHGFAQSPASWQPVVQALGAGVDVFVPEIRGHGTSALVAGEPSFASVRDDLIDLWDHEQIGRAVLWGYSQGARIALDLALHDPQMIAGLVLESGTAGLENETERDARRIADTGLASWIEQHTPEEFAAHWENQPVFADQSEQAIAAQRTVRASHDPMALAAALRGLGQAAFDPVWDRLSQITAPTLLLTGSRDTKYTALASRMAEAIPNAHHTVVVGAGHSVHLECPDDAVDEVQGFLARIGGVGQAVE